MSNCAMNNETYLDWLARHVHVWPEGMREVLVCYPRNVDTLIWSCVLSNTGWITKEQWLARRAELQNKPSWNDAPEWGEWLAQDEDGEWKWLAGLPGKYVDGWTAVKIKGCCKGSVLGDWRDTLEQRPTDLSSAAVVKRLDEATQNVLAAVPALMGEKFRFDRDDWFERGELPPVGTRCVALLGIAPKANCEVIAKTEQQMVVKWEENGMMDVIDLDVHAEFRPISTEREVAIEEMCNVAGLDGLVFELVAGKLYDAGYRKESK